MFHNVCLVVTELSQTLFVVDLFQRMCCVKVLSEIIIINTRAVLSPCSQSSHKGLTAT